MDAFCPMLEKNISEIFANKQNEKILKRSCQGCQNILLTFPVKALTFRKNKKQF